MQYLPVCVESGEGSVQHAAPHLGVAVIQSVRDKEEEEGRDLGFVQVLRQFVQSQGDATPDGEVWGSTGDVSFSNTPLVSVISFIFQDIID